MEKQNVLTTVLDFFENTSHGERFTTLAITRAHPGVAHPQIAAACQELTAQGRLTVHREVGLTSEYSKGPLAYWKRIVPLFAGTPEFLVCHRSGEVMAWCPTEIFARLIVNAMNGE